MTDRTISTAQDGPSTQSMKGRESAQSPPDDQERLARRLEDIQERIDAAAIRAGRNPESVRILPVTKFVPAERMRHIYDLGLHSFGESRIQELRQKATELAELEPTWVFIGHLQTNKAGQAARIVDEVQSVNSLRIARSLSRTRVAWNENSENPSPSNLQILVQVNTSGEQTKSGFGPDEVEGALAEIAELPGLQPRGFMTMAPHTDDTEEVRASFRRLREVRDEMIDRFAGELALPELSMGMSNDYEVAVEEGTTTLRLGTVIFGDRYS